MKKEDELLKELTDMVKETKKGADKVEAFLSDYRVQ